LLTWWSRYGLRPTRPPEQEEIEGEDMKNPFGDQKVPGDYRNLKERMYKKVSTNVNDQISNLLKTAYEKALGEENVILSRPERKRLFSQIVNMVMDDILKK
jgi:hypothetical protein